LYVVCFLRSSRVMLAKSEVTGHSDLLLVVGRPVRHAVPGTRALDRVSFLHALRARGVARAVLSLRDHHLVMHRLSIIRGEQCERRGRGSFGMSLETCMSISSGSAPGSRATSSTRRIAEARSPGAALMGSAGRNADHIPQTIPPLRRTTGPLTHSPSSPTRRDDAGRVLDRTEPLQGGVKKVWEADTLRYPKSLREMRIVSLINEEDVIERILRHLGLWQRGACAFRHRPARRNDLDPWLDDPFPDYDTEPVLIFPEN
jgi:hypothetical protein